MAAATTHFMMLPSRPTAEKATFSRGGGFRIRARSDSRDGAVNDSSLMDDIRYVLKLGGGSVAGAAVIKYGSVLAPQITKPNLPEALFIIITPVVAAALILIAKKLQGAP
uniref:Uncharacterized protein n=1 Tax=Kalanchoe fedtschenkoi TaxID=63787 RepID=A0A7N0VL27_KALFE